MLTTVGWGGESSGDPAACNARRRIAVCVEQLASLRDALDGRPVPDGTYIVQAHVVAGLRARGHRVTVAAPRDLRDVEVASDLHSPILAARTWSARRWFDMAGRVAWRGQQWLGVPYLNVFSNYRHLDAYLQCLRGHDVVYERSALYSFAVARACRRLALPYVLFFEADQLMELEFRGRPLVGALRWRAQSVLRYTLQVADCVTCVSEPAKARLTSVWRVPPEKVVVCPNGADVGLFRSDPDARVQVRAALGLAERPLIVFVGSFFEWYDISTLLDAFALVLPRHPEAHLLLVGDGAQREAMMRHAQRIGIDHAAMFTGLVPHHEVARLLSAADIAAAVYPRMTEELWLSPLKLYEYMASGAAIVASASGQVAQVVDHGRNGLLVPPGDSRALASALSTLLDDAPLRARLCRNARRDAVEKHSWDAYLERLERIFDAVIARRPLPAV